MRLTQPLSLLLPVFTILSGGCGDVTGVDSFSWTLTNEIHIAQGATGHVELRVKSKTNINHDVGLALGSAPAGMVVTVPPKMTSTQETADITVFVPPNMPGGTYDVVIQAAELDDDPFYVPKHVDVVVPGGGGPPDFALSVTPNPATPEVDAVTNFDYTVTALNGFVGTVTMTLTGLPDDLTYAVGLTPFTFTFVEGGPLDAMGHFRLVYHPVGPVSSPALLQLSASSDQTIHTETITINLLAP
jgi:hypothetical protein